MLTVFNYISIFLDKHTEKKYSYIVKVIIFYERSKRMTTLKRLLVIFLSLSLLFSSSIAFATDSDSLDVMELQKPAISAFDSFAKSCLTTQTYTSNKYPDWYGGSYVTDYF